MQQNNLTPCGLVWLNVPGKHMNKGQDEQAPDQTFSLNLNRFKQLLGAHKKF